jgi:hypothetical protein
MFLSALGINLLLSGSAAADPSPPKSTTTSSTTATSSSKSSTAKTPVATPAGTPRRSLASVVFGASFTTPTPGSEILSTSAPRQQLLVARQARNAAASSVSEAPAPKVAPAPVQEPAAHPTKASTSDSDASAAAPAAGDAVRAQARPATKKKRSQPAGEPIAWVHGAPEKPSVSLSAPVSATSSARAAVESK